MPIKFDEKALINFLGVEPTYPNVEECTEKITFYDYAGAKLNYAIWLMCDTEVVMISGSADNPFGGDSFYEISIPCDSIVEIPDGYYPHQTGLGFFYGDTCNQFNLMLMLLKRPDGDLKVWPNTNWPERHEYHKFSAPKNNKKRFEPAT